MEHEAGGLLPCQGAQHTAQGGRAGCSIKARRGRTEENGSSGNRLHTAA